MSSPPREFADAASVAHHDDAVADVDQFLGVGRGEQDRVPPLAEIRPDALDLAPRADVDAARRVDHDQDASVGGQPAGDLHLLLVAAGKRPHLGIDRRGLDLEAIDLIAGVTPRRPRHRACHVERSSPRLAMPILSAIDWSPIRQSRRSCAISPRPSATASSGPPIVDSRRSSTRIVATQLAAPGAVDLRAPPRCSRRRAGRTVRRSRPCEQ